MITNEMPSILPGYDTRKICKEIDGGLKIHLLAYLFRKNPLLHFVHIISAAVPSNGLLAVKNTGKTTIKP